MAFCQMPEPESGRCSARSRAPSIYHRHLGTCLGTATRINLALFRHQTMARIETLHGANPSRRFKSDELQKSTQVRLPIRILEERKDILGFALGPSEEEAFWLDFLRILVSREA